MRFFLTLFPLRPYKKPFVGGLCFCSLLSACGSLEPVKSFEKTPPPGLFSGEKGYFEIAPGGAQNRQDFENAPGFLEEHERTVTDLSADSAEEQLEALAAS